MDQPERFRVFFWQKLTPLIALVVPAYLFVASPTAERLPIAGWVALGGAVAAGVAWWIRRAWSRSAVLLDDDGLTCWVAGVSLETWPYDKLLNIKRYGRYRVRMCFDPDVPDTHMHITLDLTDVKGFVDALLDRYAETAGHELELADAA